MEKRINKRVDQYIVQFKDDLRKKISDLNLEDNSKMGDLMQYIYEYEKLCLTKDDFIKRKRVKNSIPNINRCSAKRANGEQCTRRRKPDCEYCGTHYKGVPHGFVGTSEDPEDSSNKKIVEIFAEDIYGIIYYLDKYNNVYSMSDVLQKKENPQIVGKYEKNGNEYKITML